MAGLKPAPTNPSRFRDPFEKWFKAKKLSVVSECHSGALRHAQGKIPPKESALVSSKKADASLSLSIGNDNPLGASVDHESLHREMEWFAKRSLHLPSSEPEDADRVSHS